MQPRQHARHIGQREFPGAAIRHARGCDSSVVKPVVRHAARLNPIAGEQSVNFVGGHLLIDGLLLTGGIALQRHPSGAAIGLHKLVQLGEPLNKCGRFFAVRCFHAVIIFDYYSTVNKNVDLFFPPGNNAGMGLDNAKMRRLREDAKLSQEEAARKAGMKTKQAWNRIESGTHLNVSIDTLEAIAKALGCKAKDLLK
jgi:DNA-binding XRE family transcriptional regulator